MIKTKKRPNGEIRDDYMRLTFGVKADDFTKYLPIVMRYIDDHKMVLSNNADKIKKANAQYETINVETFKGMEDREFSVIRKSYKKMYKELQEILVQNGCGNGPTVRKIINTYIKTGFVKPLFEDYLHIECQMYLEAKTDAERTYIKGQVFYQYGSSNASFSENYFYLSNGKIFKDVQFIFNTLYKLKSHCLSEKDIIGLMITVPESESDKLKNRNRKLIEKGFLNKRELIEQYNISKYISLIKDKECNKADLKLGVRYFERHFEEIIKKGRIDGSRYKLKLFEERKYNQIEFMMSAISDYPGICRKNKTIFIKELSENWESEDKKKFLYKRDPIRHQMYRNYLLGESEKIYKKAVCYADKIAWKGLVASHIVPFNECESLGHSEWEYDGNNGLLLSPNIDAYFDKNDISFEDDGRILISQKANVVDCDVENILRNCNLDKNILNEKRVKFLRIHRKKYNIKQKETND